MWYVCNAGGEVYTILYSIVTVYGIDESKKYIELDVYQFDYTIQLDIYIYINIL